MSNLKTILKDKSPLRQQIDQVDLLKENDDKPSDRPTAPLESSIETDTANLTQEEQKEEEKPTARPSLKYMDRPQRESVRKSYQFYYDQDKKLRRIQAYYSKKKGNLIPLSFFTKRAFDEYIERCFAKIREEGGEI